MEYDTSLAEEVYALAKRWDASRSIADISKLEFKANDLSLLGSQQIGADSSFFRCNPF
jgi:leukotriene-A4 hydrolase